MLSAGLGRTKNDPFLKSPIPSISWTCQRIRIGLKLVNKTRVGLAARSQHRCGLRMLRKLFPTTSDLGSPSRSSPLRSSRARRCCYRIMVTYINVCSRVCITHTAYALYASTTPFLTKNGGGSIKSAQNGRGRQNDPFFVLDTRFDCYHIENPLVSGNCPAPKMAIFGQKTAKNQFRAQKVFSALRYPTHLQFINTLY